MDNERHSRTRVISPAEDDEHGTSALVILCMTMLDRLGGSVVIEQEEYNRLLERLSGQPGAGLHVHGHGERITADLWTDPVHPHGATH